MRAADRVTLRKKVVEWMFPSRFTTYSLPPRPIQFQLGPILSAFFSSFPPFIQRSPETFSAPPISPPLRHHNSSKANGRHHRTNHFPLPIAPPPTPPPPLPQFFFPGLLFGSRPNLSQTTPHHPRVTFAAGSSLLFHYVVDKAMYAYGPARYTGYAHGHGFKMSHNYRKGGMRKCGAALLYG